MVVEKDNGSLGEVPPELRTPVEQTEKPADVAREGDMTIKEMLEALRDAQKQQENQEQEGVLVEKGLLAQLIAFLEKEGLGQERDLAPAEGKVTQPEPQPKPQADKVAETAEIETLTINGVEFEKIGNVVRVSQTTKDPDTGLETIQRADVADVDGKAWAKLVELDGRENNTDISREGIREELDKILTNDAATDRIIGAGDISDKELLAMLKEAKEKEGPIKNAGPYTFEQELESRVAELGRGANGAGITTAESQPDGAETLRPKDVERLLAAKDTGGHTVA